MSTRRYFPPRGTAGFERCCVSGKRREPAPPPRITDNTLFLSAIAFITIVADSLENEWRISVKRRPFQDERRL
jgi:hypothetical protein